MAAVRKTAQYSSKATIDKLIQLEEELRLILLEDMAPYVRVSIISQLQKVAAQIDAARPVEVTDSDPIQAIRLATFGR